MIDRDGRLLVGDPPPQATIDARPDFDPVELTVEGTGWVVYMLAHEGDAIGWIIVPRRRRNARPPHLHRVADAFVVDGIKRAMSARMHMATVEEANRELTEKNRRLAQAVERLQEADRVKSNFLATVSHELRTPLTSVIGYSEMLLEGIAGELNDEQREYVRTVMEKGDQLLQLITGILDISRMEAGEMRIDKQPFDLDEVVSVALSTIAPHARRKKLQHGRARCRRRCRWCSAIATRSARCCSTCSATPSSSRPRAARVEVSAQLAPLLPAADTLRAVQISVHDSGIGMPPEHQKRIFDPFFQVDNTSTREYGGTGLGLVDRQALRRGARRRGVGRSRTRAGARPSPSPPARARPREVELADPPWTPPSSSSGCSAIGALLLASAFFAGSETALFSLSRAAARGDGGARGRGLAAAGCAAVAPAAAHRHHHRLQRAHQHRQLVARRDADRARCCPPCARSAQVVIATAVMLPLILFVGEMTPKSLAHAPRRALGAGRRGAAAGAGLCDHAGALCWSSRWPRRC